MTDGTEETITDPEEAPAKRTRRKVPRKTRIPRKKPPPAYIQLSPALQSELRRLQHAAARGSSASAEEWARVSRAADNALALLLPDKGQGWMQISTVYMSQEGVYGDHDTENDYETETDDETQQCDETEQWLIEDYFRQRCEAKARRDTQKCCRNLTALGRKDWKTWIDVPLDLRKDIERIQQASNNEADWITRKIREKTHQARKHAITLTMTNTHRLLRLNGSVSRSNSPRPLQQQQCNDSAQLTVTTGPTHNAAHPHFNNVAPSQ